MLWIAQALGVHGAAPADWTHWINGGIAELIFKGLYMLIVYQNRLRNQEEAFRKICQEVSARIESMPKYMIAQRKQYLGPMKRSGGIFNPDRTMRKCDYGLLLFQWR